MINVRSGMPRITLVTPSFNQSKYLEETILSVLNQNYPNLEYRVIDGGSHDGSVDIIKKYAAFLDGWVSEPDLGQSHAVNKGFAHAHGDIMGWLNSDDQLEPGALKHVAKRMRGGAEWITGASKFVKSGESRAWIKRPRGEITRARILPWYSNWFPQASTFWSRDLWEKSGPLDEELHYVMDYELWLRMSRYAVLHTTSEVLSLCHWHRDAKSFTAKRLIFAEMMKVMRREARGRERVLLPFYSAGLGAKRTWDLTFSSLRSMARR